ncbi:hypothetical protein D0C16_17120 [Cellvibrio sp. KY-GH-1]|uniref:hypothetical protein n=1 Tax=Cellvibrio sp. KY-GH-1 TaxID=2303332 RepID=UPI0012450F40|nr:hypothetical protein [Cellvibrio sp. KY-GH-1]QEY17553.1 hypothetical protein D0C16_17120 [Cellvibrio sp. KY-GH-1]
MLYLLDSDVAKKLVQYNLIAELIHGLGCKESDLAILPQLKYQLGLHLVDKSKALRKLGTSQAVSAAVRLVTNATEVVITSNAANPILSLNHPNLDSGEKTLLAALATQVDDKLISGDKRALVAISKIGDLPIENLWARILSLEEAIFIIAISNTFKNISDKICSQPSVDTAISIVFGKSTKNDFESVKEGLISFMQSLRVDTQGCYFFPKV